MSSGYAIPARLHRVEEVMQRSRFITTVAPAPTVEAARAFIAAVRGEFPDATHNCWAYLVGPPGSTAQIGYSDDGEPHGTAGKPMFTVLEHSGVGDIAAVVTRYFGGILLGKGGLVRAYSGGVKLALQSLPLVHLQPMAELLAVVDYSAVTPIRRLLSEFGAQSVAEDYGVDVTYRIRLPEERLAALEQALINLTDGQVILQQHVSGDRDAR